MPFPEPSLRAERAPSQTRATADPELAARALAALDCSLIICDPSLPDNPIVYANPAFEAVTGYLPSEAAGRNCRFLQGKDTDPAVVGEIAATLREARPFARVILNYHKDGSTFWNEMNVAPIHDGAGRITHFVGLLKDISGHIQAQQALQATTARLEVVIASLQAGMMVEDDGGQVVLTNQTFCDMLGLQADAWALTGANVAPLLREAARQFSDSDGFLEQARERRQRQEPVQAEEMRLRDGRVWERDYVPIFPNGSAAGLGGHLWLLRDVTERREIEQRFRDAVIVLEYQKTALEQANADLEEANTRLEEANGRLGELAMTDGLTGLLNQRVFGERLAEEFRRARRYGEPLSLILLDVDRFKAYNDAFGHLAANAVLRQMGAVLRAHARETDLVARFGGEEFALILPHTDTDEATLLAERLRSRVEDTPWEAGHAVTASFGVSTLAPETVDADVLVACADAALYRAKEGGRNRVARERGENAKPSSDPGNSSAASDADMDSGRP